jgi:hypothetical protein
MKKIQPIAATAMCILFMVLFAEELAAARAKHSDKARKGNRKAIEALEEVKRNQKQLVSRRENALYIQRVQVDEKEEKTDGERKD